MQRGATFFNGKPCKNGHVAPRYLSDRSCIECAIQRATKRYSENSEQIKSYSKKRYIENQEYLKKHQNDRRLADLEKSRKVRREEYKRNRQKYLDREKQNRLKNIEAARIKGREVYRRNKATFTAHSVKRYLTKLKRTPPWLSKEQRRQIKDFYKKASELNNTDDRYHVDHIVPLRGRNVSGLHVPWNLQILKASDNLAKSNKF